jgi:hypothetical protein
MESVNTQLELLRERIPYDEVEFETTTIHEETLKKLLEDSKYIALSLRFPYEDYYDYELPKKYYNWQLRCCEELYKLIGSTNIKSYSENGLSWTRDSANLSTNLVEQIEPMVGYIGSDDNVF